MSQKLIGDNNGETRHISCDFASGGISSILFVRRSVIEITYVNGLFSHVYPLDNDTEDAEFEIIEDRKNLNCAPDANAKKKFEKWRAGLIAQENTCQDAEFEIIEPKRIENGSAQLRGMEDQDHR